MIRRRRRPLSRYSPDRGFAQFQSLASENDAHPALAHEGKLTPQSPDGGARRTGSIGGAGSGTGSGFSRPSLARLAHTIA